MNSAEELHEGALSGPVFADDANDLTGLNGDIKRVESDVVAESLRQSGRLDHLGETLPF